MPVQNIVIFRPVRGALAAAAMAFGLAACGDPGTESSAPGTSARQDRSPAAAASPPAAQTRASAAAGAPSQTPETDRFVFERLVLETDRDDPRACLRFSQPLDESGRTDYSVFVSMRPAARPALSAEGHHLCFAGLQFGQDYQATLKEGLPSADGAELTLSETVPVSLQDRPAALAFEGGLLLPRNASDGIPLTAVNVDMVKITVIRVGDRLLARLRQGLLDTTSLYSYDADELREDQGTPVWTGEMEIDAPRNATAKTLFPFREAVPSPDPGAYLILAEDSKANTDTEYWRPRAAQWVIDSDMGLTSFTGNAGLTVAVRSLRSARALTQTRVTLIARNNTVLGELRTDSDGLARFPRGLLNGPGGAEPVAVMAYGANGDFNYLDLRRPAFDLTDRGVAGRTAPGPIDAFLYLDRGIYRPGETVQLTTLLRDQKGMALDDAPLTLVISRPDGVESRRFTLTDQTVGMAVTPIALSASAPRGRWQAAAYIDTNAPPVGRVQFDVQDFVPEQLKVTLSGAPDFLRPGAQIDLAVEARFLYGAPAAGLTGSAEAVLSIDTAPFPDYEDYLFGRVEERFGNRIVPLDMGVLDAEGRAALTGTLPDLSAVAHPLKAQVNAALTEPGGRTTRQTLSVPVRGRDVYLGLRPGFKHGRAAADSPANFELIALDAAGARLARSDTRWELIREDVRYQWYEVDGAWRYERIVRDRPVAEGAVDIASGSPAQIAESLPWGTYRLIAEDPVSGASVSTRFSVGWGGALGDSRPDRVEVIADKSRYRPGDTALLTLSPPSAGKALVVVAGDRIYRTEEVDVPAGGKEVRIPVSANWGAGAYVLVTHYRPLSDRSRAPVRSVGVAWLGIDSSDHRLEIALDLPEVAAPQRDLTVPIRVTGEDRVNEVALTLAAVDEGILQLTRFKTPDPFDYYFGDRALGVDIRDVYGRLILGEGGAVGTLRSGGDSAFGGPGLTEVPQRTVALFSGLVPLDKDGRGEVTLSIPDFTGEFRVMAIAASPTAIGSTEMPVTVRNEIVGTVSFPRFLAPGDVAELTLSVHNVEGPAGTYRAAIEVDGAASVPGESVFNEALATGARKEVLIPLTATATGRAGIALTVTGPGGIRIERSWPLTVRPAQIRQSSQEIRQIPPSAETALTGALTDPYYPETAFVSMAVGAQRSYDVAGLIRWLDRYPYGCLEQTVSRAVPLLYFNQVAEQANLQGDEAVTTRLRSAVNSVLDMQRSDGAFGMWSYRGRPAAEWLSVYAMDFLTRARAQNYPVPRDAVERGLGWLAARATQNWADRDVRAYAFYVLAREGRAALGDLRYFHDREREQITDPLSAGFLAAALAQSGDRARAVASFDYALALFDRPPPQDDNAPQVLPYGSPLRDVTALTALAAESEAGAVVNRLNERNAQYTRDIRQTTTQEKAWMLLAAHALTATAEPLSLIVDGSPWPAGSGQAMLTPAVAALRENAISVRNEGGTPVWATVSVQGIPTAPQGARAEGVTLTKRLFTLDGTPVTGGRVTQSGRMVVLVEGVVQDREYREMALLDLLPAGLEIEAVIPPGEQTRAMYPFLPDLTPTDIAEARHDRFVAAFTTGSRFPNRRADAPKTAPFASAYLVRAVTPGKYTFPGAHVEDMYAPAISAQTAQGEVTVEPATP